MGPIVWCQVVSSFPPPTHKWWSIAGRRPLYVIGCCSITQLAVAKKLRASQLFSPQPVAFFLGSRCGSNRHSQNRQDSFKWIRKPVFSPDHPIWSKYSLRVGLRKATGAAATVINSGCIHTTKFSLWNSFLKWKRPLRQAFWLCFWSDLGPL